MLDAMTVELLRSMGDDLSIVNAARVSYAKEATWVCGAPKDHQACALCGTLKPADASLINYLMREHHGTPFEMVQFQFRLHLPVRVMWEWIRHRIASYNGVSSRYVVMEKTAYVPPPEAIRGRVGRPGHYQTVPLAGLDADRGLIVMQQAYEYAYGAYSALLHLGWAPELAANVLPFGTYTEFIWSVNLRSLLNFCELRNAPPALLELRTMAQEVERLATAVAPEAFAAFTAHGRRAP